MSDPLIEIAGLSKPYGHARPLRIAELRVEPADRTVLFGLDVGGAETFVHLVTGAALPDEGEVRIAGRPTRDIASGSEWLDSLDRFGLVSERAVLFEELPTMASLALPLSLSIDPMPPAVRRRVEELAAAVGLAAPRLTAPVSALSIAERMRVHLARAIAHGPTLVLLELPTARLETVEDRRVFGRTLATVSAAYGFGWLALSDDEDFARAAGGTRLRLLESGAIRRPRRWPWGRTRV